jgi:hypothetical protein
MKKCTNTECVAVPGAQGEVAGAKGYISEIAPVPTHVSISRQHHKIAIEVSSPRARMVCVTR